MQSHNDFNEDPPTVVADSLRYEKHFPPPLTRISMDPSEEMRISFAMWWMKWGRTFEIVATVSVVPITIFFMWLWSNLGGKQ